MTRIGVVLLATCLTALLAAAPGTLEPRPAVAGGSPLPARIVDSGFVVEPQPVCPIPPPVPTRRVLVALRVENPNANWTAEDLTIAVRLLATDGAPVAETVLSLAQLLPTERRNAIAHVELSPNAPRVFSITAVAGEPSRWRRSDGVPLSTVSLRGEYARVPGLSVLWGVCVPRPGQRQVVGSTHYLAITAVTNPLDVPLGDVEVAVIAFDREGRIIGGGRQGVDIDALGSKTVSVHLTMPERFREIARVEVTAAYPWLDLTPYEW